MGTKPNLRIQGLFLKEGLIKDGRLTVGGSFQVSLLVRGTMSWKQSFLSHERLILCYKLASSLLVVIYCALTRSLSVEDYLLSLEAHLQPCPASVLIHPSTRVSTMYITHTSWIKKR